MSIRPHLEQLGITLPTPPGPAADYDPLVESHLQIFISGQLPVVGGGTLLATGKVGAEVDLETARRCARQCVLNALALLDQKLGGGLDRRVEQVVRVGVYVASSPDFTDQHLVADAASGLLHEVLGVRGRHARAAVGCAALPKDAPVEVEMLVGLVDEMGEND